MLHRARHADVAQAPLLLQRLQVRHAAVVREESFLHPAEKDELEFETLCHVQRHHLHAVLSGIGLSLTGLQYRVRQEGMERRQVDIGALRGEAAGGADELREVLEARFAARHLAAGLGARRALIRLLPAVMLDEPAILQHEIHLLVQGEPFGLPRQPVDEIMEAAYGARRPAALLRLAASDGRFPQRGTGASRLLAQGLHGSLADTARREIKDPLIGGIVVPIRHQPQIRERVFYLRALEEPQAAIDLVWNAAGDERFLERTRLSVGSVQHRDVAAPIASGDIVDDTASDELRLVPLVEGGVDLDGQAGLTVSPQRLAQTAGVVCDQPIGGGQDRRGGAVVLLQPVEFRAGVVPAELLQILHARAAPAVDRLVVIAHYERVSLGSGDEAQPGVLDGVGILEFVNQHVPEALTVMRQELRMVAPELVGAQQQLREIDHPRARAGLLVETVEPDHLRAGKIVAGLQVLRTAALVLVRVDEPLYLARLPARLVEIVGPDDPLHQALLVIRIENLEALGESRLSPVQPQQAVRDAVEGADPQHPGRGAEDLLHAAAHFTGRLVGEGDRQNGV